MFRRIASQAQAQVSKAEPPHCCGWLGIKIGDLYPITAGGVTGGRLCLWVE